MPKRKIPIELQHIAAEIGFDLCEEETDDLGALLEQVREEIDEAQSEALEHYNDLKAKVDTISADQTTE
jgi:hypothetical protein